MFTLAIFIGIYSYLIFFLGIFGLLYRQIIIITTIIYVIGTILLFLFLRVGLPSPAYRPPLLGGDKKKYIPSNGGGRGWVTKLKYIKKILSSRLIITLIFLFLLQVIINFIGALGPELAFDALWYHLTLPKLFLASHKIFYIPGGLFYYATMPKLMEMLYIAALTFGNEITAKCIHFSFGILTSIALYRLSRKFFNPLISLLTVVIFYSNLVVAWESITAYIDLGRTFFEVLSLHAFINWVETKEKKWFVMSALLVGFAITTKILAIGSLIVFLELLIFSLRKSKQTIKQILVTIFTYCGISLSVPLPWLIFSYSTTGNPLYPFFTKIYEVSSSIRLLNPSYFLQSLWNLFTHAADPISPIYIALVPLLIVRLLSWSFSPHPNPLCPEREQKVFLSRRRGIKGIILYSISSLFIWYVTPDTGGGRFIVPYLPVYSLLIGSIFAYSFYPLWIKKILISVIIFAAFISIGYRGIANKRYIPVLIGRETKGEFLTHNLNFSFGDFYDTDAYFAKNIKSSDNVLLYGFHNIYYVNFPFIDSSYVKKGNRFNYIAEQHGTIPKSFSNWKPMYQNRQTNVTLYALPNKQWISY